MRTPSFRRRMDSIHPPTMAKIKQAIGRRLAAAIGAASLSTGALAAPDALSAPETTIKSHSSRRQGTTDPSEGIGFFLTAETFAPGDSGTVLLEWNPSPEVSALSFSLNFDPSRLEFVEASLPEAHAGALLMTNDGNADTGSLGFLVAARPGSELNPDSTALVELQFLAIAAGDTGLTFSDFPTKTKLSDTASRSVPMSLSVEEIAIESEVPGFDDWAEELAEHLAEEGIELIPVDRNLDADPDGDGITNEWEYYLGTSPAEADGGPLKPAVTQEDGEIETLAVSLEFRSDRMQGECIAEVSFDMVHWNPIDRSTDQDLGANRTRTTWRVEADGGQGYVRMRLIRP